MEMPHYARDSDYKYPELEKPQRDLLQTWKSGVEGQWGVCS